MDDVVPIPAGPNVLPYARERFSRASAVWAVIGGMSVVAQCGFASLAWQMTELGLAGIARVQANPKAFGRLVAAEDVQRLVDIRGGYVALQAAFVVACLFVAGASLWLIVTSCRRKSAAELAETFRRHARLKAALTVGWVVAFYVAMEADRQLVVRLTRHISVGSTSPMLPSLVLGGWGLFMARQLRLEAARLQPRVGDYAQARTEYRG